jgi:3-oxoacyl-[acyl-carrier-protein] synthase-3
MSGARITGWGYALPDKIVTNHDLELTLDTSDEWIRERTGIRERRVGGTTCGLATEACQVAMERAGVAPADVDLLVVCTTTPDQAVPATASAVQEALGVACGAFDLNAACSGFVYGLVTAAGFLGSGLDTVLVVGSETLSRITDWEDRGTAILFGDGAGAVVLEATEGDSSILAWDLASDGTSRKYLYCDLGGYVYMEGKEVFRRAVRVMVDSAEKSMAKAGVGPDDIALVVPHQANTRIIDAACQRLGIPMERASIVIDWTGNNSSASIPIALADALDKGRLHKGDLALLVGFGAGMTSASAVVRWDA